MTIVAYDGKTIVADRRVTYGSIPHNGGGKLVYFPKESPWLVAGLAGRRDQCVKAIRYLINPAEARPDIKEHEIDILLIDKKGKAFSYAQYLEPVETPIPWAVGSGDNYALGAMAVGATALEAAKAAVKLDVACGDGFDVFKVRRSMNSEVKR